MVPVEGSAVEVNSAGQAVRLLHEVADHGEHGDAAVLELRGAAAVKDFNIAIGSQAERVPEPDWGQGANLVLKGRGGRGGLLGL